MDMIIAAITLLLLLALFIETTVLRLPLLLLLLLVIFVKSKSPLVFTIAFITGIILDAVTVQRVGLSSLFFIVFLFLVYLYDRKYEIRTLPFVLIAGLAGSYIFALLFSIPLSFIYIILVLFISGLFFIGSQIIEL